MEWYPIDGRNPYGTYLLQPPNMLDWQGQTMPIVGLDL